MIVENAYAYMARIEYMVQVRFDLIIIMLAIRSFCLPPNETQQNKTKRKIHVSLHVTAVPILGCMVQN